MLPYIRLLLVTTALRLLALLPLPLNHRLGGWLGRLYYLFPNRMRAVTRVNIDLCFPELPVTERARLVRATLGEVGKTICETGPAWFWHRQRLQGLIRGATGDDLLRQALTGGKGVIIAAPHLGSWEILGHYLLQFGPVTNLYRPPRLPEMDGLIRKSRTRFGAGLAPTSPKGIKILYQVLARNEMVGILPDQDPGRGGAGEFAPFFAISANTMSLLPRLTQKTGAAVIFAFARRLPAGQGYHIHFLAAPPEIGGDDLHRAVTGLNAGVEACVRQVPEQYQWGYKRFRTRPAGEKKLY